MSAVGRSVCARKNQRRTHALNGPPKWRSRRETRSSPVSLASSGPEPLGARPFVFGREAGTRRDAV
jgi:hypothetical protein